MSGKIRISVMALCLPWLCAGYALGADTPYYGGFGVGFLHINADGTYGKGEIRSGDLGLGFYGPTFGGPYNFKIYTMRGSREWTCDLVAGAPGMRVGYRPLFPHCNYTFQHDSIPLSVTMEVFVAGSWMMQPLVAIPVGTVIVLSPAARTSCCTCPLAAALVSVMGPTARDPVGVLLIVPEIMMLAVAAIQAPEIKSPRLAGDAI